MKENSQNYTPNAGWPSGENQTVTNQSGDASTTSSQAQGTIGENKMVPTQAAPSDVSAVIQKPEIQRQYAFPCAGNAYWNFNQLPEANQQNLAVAQMQGEMRLQEYQDMLNAKLQFEINKQYIKDASEEARRERQRAQSQEVMRGSDRKYYVITSNTLIPARKREAINFQPVKLCRLMSSSGETGVFLLVIEIHGKETEIFLDEQKCENIRYIMKKIRGVGGDFLARKRTDKEDLAFSFWDCLKSEGCPVVTVPDDIGWMKTEDGYRFVEEEELTWKKIKNILN